MDVESAEVELAYTYAWWLTGDARAARSAVLAAVDRPDVPGADADLRLEILLRRVRAAAVQQPTMCPASELALLHDAIGLGLDSAAGLAMVDAREARTELAHGRLEALGPDVEVEVVEPHRLGGLAVGNPADVAAARQNPKLGRLRANILKGRDELVDVSRIPVPRDLLDAIELRRGGGGPLSPEPLEPEWFAARAEPPSVEEPAAPGPAVEAPAVEIPTVQAPVAAADLDDAEEIDLSDSGLADAPRSTPGPVRDRRGFAVLAGVALLAVVAVLAVSLRGGARDAADVAARPTGVATAPATAADQQDAPAPAATAPGTAEPTGSPPAADPTAEPTPSPTPSQTPPGFNVTQVGVAVGIGGQPTGDNPTAGRFDPVSISVAYAGAEPGDALVADWTVDGEPYDAERADLSPLLSESRFSKPVPEEGWPAGQHVLALVLERTGEVVGEARFRVA